MCDSDHNHHHCDCCKSPLVDLLVIVITMTTECPILMYFSVVLTSDIA